MSRHDTISDGLPLPTLSTKCIKRLFYSNKRSNLIEQGKKTWWSFRHRQHHVSNTKGHRIHRYSQMIHKPIRLIHQRFFSKSNTRHVFDFFDQNDDSCLSYLEFRSWMLLVDRTLAEDELLQLFHDVDQNGDGFIQYKEFSDYFGADLQSNDPSIVDLTILFNDIDLNHSGEIKLDDLLKFFNHQSTMISKEEGELFFHLASDVKDEPKINLEAFLKLMCE